ncbi:cyclic nucleotide-binding domain-containing protein [soil metagenome]
MNQDLTSALANHRFLHGLSGPQIAALAECARPVTAAAETHLFRESQAADACYLLQTGRLALEIHAPRRGAVVVQTIAAGDIVGWSWLIPPYLWQFDARTVEPVQALALDGARLRQKLEQDHELGFQFLQRLIGVVCGRLAATRLQLLDVYK